jgi:hypothetical protein
MHRSTIAAWKLEWKRRVLGSALTSVAFTVSVLPQAGGFAQDRVSEVQASAGQAAASDRAVEERIAQLIEQLSSPDFLLREQASFELLSMGEPAIRPLKQAMASLPFEARERCRLIESRLATQLFAQRSRLFLLDRDPGNSYGFPGWKEFCSVVGTTRTSKLLFLEMLRTDRELVQLVVQARSVQSLRDDASQEELATRLIEKAESLNARLYTHSAPALGEYVSLLYAAAVMDRPPPIEVNRMLFSACQLSFGGYLRRAGYEECLKRLIAAWIPRTHDAMASEAIRLAHALDLGVAAPIARTRLSGNFDVLTRSTAFQYLAFYGDVSDLPALLEHIDDAMIIEQYTELGSDIAVSRVAPPGIPFVPQGAEEERKPTMYTVRIHDVAALAAMLVVGEDPSVLFPRYGGRIEGKLILHELAVPEEDASKRVAAIKAWVRSRLGAPPQG